ncbi:hypothetical protein ACFYPW_31400 [Micromonospora zamorensis]|uniref:hypothetical protein n=1 Tax=Micromonospora zamorensis TaxID=709883 RepID=UPI00369C0A4C
MISSVVMAWARRLPGCVFVARGTGIVDRPAVADFHTALGSRSALQVAGQCLLYVTLRQADALHRPPVHFACSDGLVHSGREVA